MAMSVTEASAVNTLLRWLLRGSGRMENGVYSVFVESIDTSEEAREAAEVLAASANKRLMAGVRPEQVRDAWPRRVEV